jgi:hypothetical protein
MFVKFEQVIQLRAEWGLMPFKCIVAPVSVRLRQHWTFVRVSAWKDGRDGWVSGDDAIA